jgi:hypothetical protein
MSLHAVMVSIGTTVPLLVISEPLVYTAKKKF